MRLDFKLRVAIMLIGFQESFFLVSRSDYVNRIPFSSM